MNLSNKTSLTCDCAHPQSHTDVSRLFLRDVSSLIHPPSLPFIVTWMQEQKRRFYEMRRVEASQHKQTVAQTRALHSILCDE